MCVPYNPRLLKELEAHINVEIVASSKTPKYLFKYSFKGHDMTSVVFIEEGKQLKYNEIDKHIEGRYVNFFN